MQTLIKAHMIATTIIGFCFALLVIFGVFCLITDPSGTAYYVGNVIGQFVKAIVVAVKSAI